MATSRPIQGGEWLLSLRGVATQKIATGQEAPENFVLQEDFGIHRMDDDPFWLRAGERVFAVPGVRVGSDPRLAAAITNGTAPGLYVREGDDTSDWETYRQVLARRVEEAMAARRGGAGGAGVGETTRAASSPLIRECHWCHNSRRITHSQDDEGRVCSYCFDWPEVAQAREDAAALAAARAMPTATTRQDNEIRVGDVVEVVSCSDAFTATADVGGGGRVVSIEHENAPIRAVYLTPCDGLRVPRAGFVSLVDVRKVTSPSPSPPITVAANASPMPDGEVARIEAAVADEVRLRISSPLAGSGDETTRQRVVNPVPLAVSVSLRPRDFTAAAITDYLQSLGATYIHVRQATGSLPVVEVTGLSQQAFDTARQNLPVGIQLRAAGGVVGRQDSGETTAARGVQSETSAAATPPTPSRFSLLEVDLPPEPTSPISRSLDADLAALQEELRVERERNRAQAAAQMQKSRFDLLECDLPAAPVAAAPVAAAPVKASSRPVVSSLPPKPRNPVETITDLTTARSPLELARILEGLNDELSTMMRQREAN